MKHLALLPLLLSTSPAMAVEYIEAWRNNSLADGQSMVGRDGWETGYDEDRWEGHVSGGGRTYVMPTTDDSY